MESCTRIDALAVYDAAPVDTLFKQNVVAFILDCSVATLERARWAGGGIPYIKMGHAVRYRKSDVEKWIAGQKLVRSSSEASCDATIRGGHND